MKQVIDWIIEERRLGTSWEDLMHAKMGTEEGLQNFLNTAYTLMHWPLITKEQWYELIRDQRTEENRREVLIDKKGVTVIHDPSIEQNTIRLSTAEDSAWQCYKRLLIDRKIPRDVVDLIEDTNLKILHQLSRDTRESGPIKGLVIGNVQSGKTSNMAALISMASDAGWNMFIVLSGMLENLRRQTSNRLIDDLNSRNSRVRWNAINNPKKVEEYGNRLRDKDFSEGSNQRYLSICLKNGVRLGNLIDWLNSYAPARENIRLLIIDDEADQASINTATNNERRRINQLILHLLNNRDSRGRQAKTNFMGVNYIGYTATPYANVLNEAPGVNSLYPSNFIVSLPVSDEYFGPQQIFGYQSDAEDETSYPGLDIIRTIPNSEIQGIGELQTNNDYHIPSTLKDALYWFLCGVAYMRLYNFSKPVSMLIHTSRKIEHHNNMQSHIQRFFSNQSPGQILQECRRIWDRETSRFTLEAFREQYPTYLNLADINDYPSFDQLEPIIRSILNIGLTHYTLNADNNQRNFTKGIHLCVDNSDDTNCRLLYPEEGEMPCAAPAFLVIGGNTLSRGLTLEGLISSYFVRPANCADTLMQMGRWFGYRKGYELIPRIWMSQRIRDQFIFMAEMDQELRDEIKLMGEIGISPTECGPKIKTSPSAQFLEIVARNRRQGAIAVDYDFSGHTMETGLFTNDYDMLQGNLDLLSRFILSLGAPSENVRNNPFSRTNKVWEDITLDRIETFLTDYQYSERLKGFNDLQALTQWLRSVTDNGILGNWNVILAGATINGERQITDTISIGKVNRSRRTPEGDDNTINIGVLRSFNDFLSDIRVAKDDEQMLTALRGVKHSIGELNRFRQQFNIANTPQLVIYVVDKDSQPRQDSKTRYPMKACQDIVGFSINIPGSRTGTSAVTRITINLQSMADYDDDDR